MYDILNKVYKFFNSETFSVMHERYMCLNTSCFNRVYSISCDIDYIKKTGIINIHFIYFDGETTAMFPTHYNNMMDYYMTSTNNIEVDNFLIIMDVNSSFFGKRKGILKLQNTEISFPCNCSYLLIANLVEITHKSLYLEPYNSMCLSKQLMIAFNGISNKIIYTNQNIKLYDFKALIQCLEDLYNMDNLKGNDLFLKYSQIYIDNIDYVENLFCYTDLEVNFTSYISSYSYTFLFNLLTYNSIKTENMTIKSGLIDLTRTDIIENISQVFHSNKIRYKNISIYQFNLLNYEYILSFQDVLYSLISNKIFDVVYRCRIFNMDEQKFNNFFIKHKDDILFKSISLDGN